MLQEKLFQDLFQKKWETGPHTHFLKETVARYPWFGAAHYFLLKEQMQEDIPESILQQNPAPLYFPNPIQLHIRLHDLDQLAQAPQIEKLSEAVEILEKEPENTNIDSLIPNQEPLHTTDYFASQGIQITEQDLNKDKVGRQLKSFTEWLKTMKKLPGGQPILDTAKIDKKVEEMADKSNTETTVLTETMAKIYLQQGKIEKAREIYEKLRLQNPDKSAYFAGKLEKLI